MRNARIAADPLIMAQAPHDKYIALGSHAADNCHGFVIPFDAGVAVCRVHPFKFPREDADSGAPPFLPREETRALVFKSSMDLKSGPERSPLNRAS
jgi:hypothetical protein